MLKALIFDFDGLLGDSETIYRRVTYQMAADFGKQLPDDIWAKQMGRSPLESLGIFREELGITTHSAQELVDLRNQLMMNAFRKDLQLMPGAREIMEGFRGKLQMAIATGSPRILLDLAVERLGLAKYFDVMLPSDEIVSGKPDPEVYLKAIHALGVQPDQCIVLEDSENGALSGHRAGCYVMVVPSGYTINQDFSCADCVTTDLTEAAEVIRVLVAGDH